ncbi:MAG: efflux RND transporter periplasmic adaptor subunit [Methylococcaceae bacterium]|nr:efflux RND transporter periplasmic adaptor subunit [Methylococcaceae bacterium]
MKRNISIVLLMQLFCIAGQVHGEDEILFTAEQIANLGLTTGALAKAGQLPLFNAPAMVKVPPAREIVVTEPNGGVVKQVYVSEGERVTQGQELIEIISSGLLGLQKDLLIAQSRYQLALRQFNREKSLFEKGVIAEKRLEEADMQFQQARISRDEAHQMLSIAGFSNSELAALIRTERLQNSRIITAPAAGVVLHKFVVTGQRVEDHDPLFSIANLSVLWLEAAAPQQNIDRIHIGDVMEIPNVPVAGRINLIDSKVDEKHQSVLVRAVVENPGGRIRPGQSVEVTVHRSEQQDLLMAPKTSLVRHEAQTLLFVRSRNGFIPRFVEAMGESDGNAIIKGKLSPDDQVAVQGTIAIKAHWLGFGGGE